ncbi:class I SAM-dependent methyltransferase [Candidatus Dojkabacteria bacterium]|nr:class I SAM-dependent methyltransferase [Candidatus Dojkabacteria bacterium]
MSVEDNMLETRGGIYRTAYSLGYGTVEALLEATRGKRILNLGSGGGGFEKDLYSMDEDGGQKIISLNLALNPLDPANYEKVIKIHKNYDDRKMEEIEEFEETPEEEKGKYLLGVEKYKKGVVCGDWKALPFPDGFFDLVFATGSFLFYTETYNDTTLKEIMRCLKPDGELRIELRSKYSISDDQIKKAGYEVEIIPTGRNNATSKNGLPVVIIRHPIET